MLQTLQGNHPKQKNNNSQFSKTVACLLPVNEGWMDRWMDG